MKKIPLFMILACSFIYSSASRRVFGSNVIISKPVYEDLYIAGGSITINAAIYGDLIIAGGTAIINDTVSNDILLLAGTAIFNGFVGDDIRCAGGKIHISKNVTGDVVITGGSVVIDRGVIIGGLLASGGDVTVDGTVNGEVRGIFGEFSLNGNVTKNIDCRGGKITINGNIDGKSILGARYIIIGDNASFNNDVRYWNKKEFVDFKKTLKNGKATFDSSLHIATGEWYYLGYATILGLLWYLGMALLLILIVQYLFSGTMKKAADTFFNSPLKAFGTGLLFFIAVPVAAVVAGITLIGVPIGVLLIIGYVSLILLSTIITAVVAANWFNNRNNYDWNFWRLTFTAFGLFILFKLASLTPFAGWVILTILVCISFGSILLNVKLKKKSVNRQ